MEKVDLRKGAEVLNKAFPGTAIRTNEKLWTFRNSKNQSIGIQMDGNRQDYCIWVPNIDGIPNIDCSMMHYQRNKKRTHSLNDTTAPDLKRGNEAYYIKTKTLSAVIELASWFAGKDSNMDEKKENRDSAQTQAGYLQDQEQKRSIELYAMAIASQAFIEKGFSIKDTSANRPYDLMCEKNGVVRYVEVKGTTTEARTVVVTQNEVEHARKHIGESILFVIANIDVAKTDENILCTGGSLHIEDPWVPEEARLSPTQYRYEIIKKET